MTTAIAYVLTFLLAPIGGAVGSLLLMPVIIAIGRTISPGIAGILIGCAGSFVAVWIGTWIFGWFDLAVGPLMLFVLGVGFLFNGFGRMATRGASPMEVGYLVGDIGGLVLAAMIFL